MTDRDINGFGARLGTQHRADDFAAIYERRPCAAFVGRLGVLTDQACLGDTDAGDIRQQADVTCDAESPRVRAALAVVQNQVRLLCEFAQGEQYRGRFPKRQQAGHVRECRRATHDRAVDELEGGKRQHGDGRARDGVAFFEAGVDAGHATYATEIISLNDVSA